MILKTVKTVSFYDQFSLTHDLSRGLIEKLFFLPTVLTVSLYNFYFKLLVTTIIFIQGS